MLWATTRSMPAASSLKGAVSRLLPQPLLSPLTITEKPPFLMESFSITPPFRPTIEYRPRVSS